MGAFTTLYREVVATLVIANRFYLESGRTIELEQTSKVQSNNYQLEQNRRRSHEDALVRMSANNNN